MPKYIVHLFMLFLICFCTDMAEEEDAREQCIREGRVCKGKPVMTNRHRKELEVENSYVPKPQRCRDVRFTITDGLLHPGG